MATSTVTPTATPTSNTTLYDVYYYNSDTGTKGIILLSTLGGVAWLVTLLVAFGIGLHRRRKILKQEREIQEKKKKNIDNSPNIIGSSVMEESPVDAKPVFKAVTSFMQAPRQIATEGVLPGYRQIFNGNTGFLQPTDSSHEPQLTRVSVVHEEISVRSANSPRSPVDFGNSQRHSAALVPPLKIPPALDELVESPDLEDEEDIWGPVSLRPSSSTPKTPVARRQSQEKPNPKRSARTSKAPSICSSVNEKSSPKALFVLKKSTGSQESIDSFDGQLRRKPTGRKKNGGRSRSPSSPSRSGRQTSSSSQSAGSGTNVEPKPVTLTNQGKPDVPSKRVLPRKSIKIIYPSFMEINIEKELAIGKKLNEGGFGELFKATVSDKRLQNQVGGTEVAIKIIKPNPKLKAELVLQDFMHEVSIIYALQFSRNVIKFYGCSRKPQLSVISKLYSCSLADLIYGEWKAHPPSAAAYVGATLDIANGLADMHQYGVAHLDVKPPNLLVEQVNEHSNYTKLPIKLVLCDFGISKVLVKKSTEEDEENSLRGKLRGGARGISYFYAAPESFAIFRIGHNPNGDYEIFKAMDVYSFAILLFEMLSLDTPWPKTMTHEILEHKVLEGERPDLRALQQTNKNLVALKQIMIQCWQNNPKDRPKFSNILDCLEPAVKNETLIDIKNLNFKEKNVSSR